MRTHSRKALPILTLIFCINYVSLIISMNPSEHRKLSNIPISKRQKSLSVHQTYLVHSCLQKINSSTMNKPLNCIVRPFNYREPSELINVSNLICTNFLKRSEWGMMHKDLIALYSQANSPESLYETMKKPGTTGFIIENNDILLGVIIMRPNKYADGSCDLQVRRLHTSFEAMDYKGVGKTLLTIAAVDASLHNIPTLMTTASMPARGFFEKLGWNGNIIQTHYTLAEEDIVLPQFQCTYQIPQNFKKF